MWRKVGLAVLILASIDWLGLGARLLAVPLLVAVVVMIPFRRAVPRAFVATWIAFAIVMLLPIDVTFRNYPGRPRVVRYVMGYPGPDTIERASRGEVILGGCIRTGFEPKYLIVW